MKQKCIAPAKKLAATLVALCLTFTMMFSASATGSTANQAVLADKTGIVQVKLVYVDPDTRTETPIQSGTGFLINDTNVVTCDHVVTMDSDTLTAAAEYLGKSESVVQNNSVIQIVYLRDTTPITTTATIRSSEMDFAVLTMSSQLYSRTYLRLRSSATVEQSETVYAMGFPALVEEFQDVNTFDSEDITINDGRVSKLNTIDGVDYVQCSATFTHGMSGGPLVDEDGNVVGIIQSGTDEGSGTEYYYAIAIDQVVTALNDRGIEYTPGGGSIDPTPDPDPSDTVDKTALQSLVNSANDMGSSDATLQSAITDAQTVLDNDSATQNDVDSALTTLQNAIDALPDSDTVDKTALQTLISSAAEKNTSDYTDETASTFSGTLSAARTVLDDADATQTDVDSAYDTLSAAMSGLEEAKDNTMMFIIIGVVAGVVVILVVVILVLTKRPKPSPGDGDYPYPTPAPQPQQPVAPAVGPTASVYGGGETSVLNAGAGETSVLNAGAGETSVLSQSSGSLTRRKTGEKVTINAANFVIGKEQSRVNYCVRDNSSVSRTHATITSRNGTAYITDMRATNGTFINGVRLTPNKETALKDGDTILLADEEFTYHTF